MYKQDTICAIATPLGEGAISIIRLSGIDTIEVIKKLFRKRNKEISVSPLFSRINGDSLKGFSLHHGFLVDLKDDPVDEVLIGVFRSPHSYTGEDLIEINMHGGRILSKKVLELLLNSGARLAESGEFTKRAFLNGKIDLSQVEAISDIIYAKSEIALKCSMKQLTGEYGEHIRNIQNELLNACSLIELELDFTEEDVEFLKRDDFIKRIEVINNELSKMIESYEIGKLYKDGVKVSIIGKPNAGKSTLLNSFLRYERAIVSDIPGTTRDFVEESILLDGILFRLIDTAGLRDADNEIEKTGIKKTFEQIDQSDIILYVFDFSQEYNDWDWENFERILSIIRERLSLYRLIIIFNKEDLVKKEEVFAIVEKERSGLLKQNISYVFISRNDNKLIDNLKNVLVSVIKQEEINYSEERVITNYRHCESLKHANSKLLSAKNSLRKGESPELISIHLRHSLNYIGEITGSVTTDDILNNIFSRFCIGK